MPLWTVILWLGVGAVAALLAAYIPQLGRPGRFGMGGDIVAGALGGIIGGWLIALLIGPNVGGGIISILVAVLCALGGIYVLRMLTSARV